jgi:hypothetical protein
VPTITCTSSNVVQTILQAFAQVRPHDGRGHTLLLTRLLRGDACVSSVRVQHRPQRFRENAGRVTRGSNGSSLAPPPPLPPCCTTPPLPFTTMRPDKNVQATR